MCSFTQQKFMTCTKCIHSYTYIMEGTARGTSGMGGKSFQNFIHIVSSWGRQEKGSECV